MHPNRDKLNKIQALFTELLNNNNDIGYFEKKYNQQAKGGTKKKDIKKKKTKQKKQKTNTKRKRKRKKNRTCKK